MSAQPVDDEIERMAGQLDGSGRCDGDAAWQRRLVTELRDSYAHQLLSLTTG